jgi:Flp pilus assembly protein TadD
LILEKVPLFLLSVASCAVTYYAQRGGGSMVFAYPFPARLGNAVASIAGYLFKTVWPTNLAVMYPHPGLVVPWGEVTVVCMILFAVTIALRLRVRRFPFLPMGWLWFLGTLLPVLGLVQVGEQAMADRYTYVPLTGLFVAAVWGVSEATRDSRKLRSASVAAGVAVLLTLSVAARIQAENWRDSLSLYTHSLSVTEKNWFLRYNIGVLLEERGATREAILNYREALRYRPELSEAHYNLANQLLSLGEVTEAVAHYREAIRIRPGFDEARQNLANAIVSQGRLEEGVALYIDILTRRPIASDIHRNLALTLVRLGRAEEADVYFEMARRLEVGKERPVR